MSPKLIGISLKEYLDAAGIEVNDLCSINDAYNLSLDLEDPLELNSEQLLHIIDTFANNCTTAPPKSVAKLSQNQILKATCTRLFSSIMTEALLNSQVPLFSTPIEFAIDNEGRPSKFKVTRYQRYDHFEDLSSALKSCLAFVHEQLRLALFPLRVPTKTLSNHASFGVIHTLPKITENAELNYLLAEDLVAAANTWFEQIIPWNQYHSLAAAYSNYQGKLYVDREKCCMKFLMGKPLCKGCNLVPHEQKQKNYRKLIATTAG